MKRKTTAGITSFSVPIKVFSTASTTGAGLTGLTSATSGLVAEYRRQGQSTWTAISLVGAPQKTLGSWTTGGFIADGNRGAYELDLPNVAMQAGARFVLVRLYGAANMLDVDIEIELDAVSYQTGIPSQVWDEAYNQHTTAGTFGKLMNILKQANTVLEGTVLASPTPTTTVFRLSGIDFPTGALEHSVLWMASGASQEQNSPILTTVNNGDGTVTVTLEEPLTTAPQAGDTVLINPTSHVHAIADIQAGLGTLDNQRYLLSILAGATSNAGTAGETYVITIGGSTYTVTYAGLDATGNRGTTAFAKT